MRPFILTCLFFTLCVFLGCSRPITLHDTPYATPLASYRYSCKTIDSVAVAGLLPELEEKFGAHLQASAYRDKMLAALSFYPELRGVKIRLIRKQLRTSMAARPLGITRRRGRRNYAIYVDDTSNKVADFRNSSYSAQVGCFIHELGHIAHYVGRSNLQLLGEGTAYVTNQGFKNRYERIADSLAIQNGGGYYVYLYRTFTFEEAELPEAYLAFKQRNYTSNKQLLAKHIAYLRENSVEKCADY